MLSDCLALKGLDELPIECVGPSRADEARVLVECCREGPFMHQLAQASYDATASSLCVIAGSSVSEPQGDAQSWARNTRLAVGTVDQDGMILWVRENTQRLR